MTKMLIVVPVLLVVALAIGCRTVQPAAGHEAVLVRKPLSFGSGGVDPTPVTGVPVRVLDMSLGRANPPDAILHQRVETAAVAAAASGRFSEPPACYREQAR